ncbi:MAG TPA: sigma-70 family RNA polymerase sigma factor, partial [Bacteroidota bacterium]
DAAYNLARWLLRTDDDAEDVVQEAFLRAFRFFDGFRGENSRSWILTIVRNSCYTWLRQHRPNDVARDPDEEIRDEDHASNPERIVERLQDEQILSKALERLPAEFREAIILRELEGFSYKEIAELAHVPLGTVMSRLARARRQLRELITQGKE